MGIKPFDIRSIGRTGLINPKQLGYQDSLDIIREELHQTRRSFVKIGWYLKHIREKEMYREENFANIYELAADKFNLSQPTATRFMNICEQFSVGHDSPELDEKYIDFNMSQLFEMLPMNQEEMSQVTPDMTVAQIRDFKKKSKKEETVPDSEDIPGQTSIQKDFREYMPDGYEDEKKEVLELGKTAEIIDGEYREIPQEQEETVYPELPSLKNTDQRKKWLQNYKTWGLWYRDENIDVNYYKYDFLDGSRLVVAEYPQRQRYWRKDAKDEYYFHLLEKNKKGYGEFRYDEKYMYDTDCETYLVEFLKKLQKKQ